MTDLGSGGSNEPRRMSYGARYVLMLITYWTTHDLYTHDSITQYVIDLN